MADEDKKEEETKEEVQEDTKEEKVEETKVEEKKEEEVKEKPKEEAKEEKKEEPEEEFEVPKEFKKMVEDIEKLSVVELAELVTVLEKKFGVSAAAPVAAGGGGGDAEEKDEYDVILVSGGDQKINAIKAVREITGLGLKESKEMVDNAPQTVKEGVKTEEAEEMKKKLEEAGATVELK